MPTQYWLFKSEPETYSFAQLTQDKKTNWDHVRNFQARNFLRAAKNGDLALIYHSGDEKAVVGIAKVVREAYPDLDPEGGDWVQIDIAPVRKLARSVSLTEIKARAECQDLLLVRHSRLSVMPITEAHQAVLVEMSNSPAPPKTTGKKPAKAAPKKSTVKVAAAKTAPTKYPKRSAAITTPKAPAK